MKFDTALTTIAQEHAQDMKDNPGETMQQALAKMVESTVNSYEIQAFQNNFK